MYATELPSDPATTIPVERRGHGRLRIEATGVAERTVRTHIEEFGFARARFPLSGRRGRALEAVLINTGGGLTGGDSSRTAIHAAASAQLVATTQAAEKVYRSDGALTRVDVELSVADDAMLDWMPQTTILFDGARLHRSIAAEVASEARLLLVEPVILGRTARGERFTSGELIDRWRIRRNGQLIYADGMLLEGDIAATLDRRACASGWAAYATLLLIAPDAESRLETLRAALDLPDGLPEHLDAGVSAWNGMVSIRFLARDGAPLDAAIRRVIPALGIAEVPRIWHS